MSEDITTTEDADAPIQFPAAADAAADAVEIEEASLPLEAPLQFPAGGIETLPEPGREATAEEAAGVTDVPAEPPPDAEGGRKIAFDEAAAKEEPDPNRPVHIAQKAQIQWLDAEDKITEVEDCWRSQSVLFVTLAKLAQEEIRPLDQKLRVVLLITDEDGKPSTMTDTEGKERSEVVLFAPGTLEAALEHFATQAMPPEVVYAKMQGAISQLSEMSNLKAALVTLVFDDAKPSAMVFTADCTEVTDDDIRILGTAGEAFIDEYKTAMRTQRNIEFPGDSSIILTGQGGLSGPGMPRG